MDEKVTAQEALDYLESDAGQGYEGMKSDQFSPTYLSILHSTAPELQEGTSEYVSGAKFGDFFNSMTRHSYGRSVEVIPLKQENLWMVFKPNNGGFLGRYMPGSIDVTGDMYTGLYDKEGNMVVEYMVYFLLLPSELQIGPVAFSLKKTGIRYGTAWNTRIRSVILPNGKTAPYYSSVWRLTTSLNKNDKGQTWYTIGSGKATNAEWVRWIGPMEKDDFVKPNRLTLQDTRNVNFAQIEAPSSISEPSEY